MIISVILEWLEQMEIAKYYIDQKLSLPHGNYQRVSYGLLSVQNF